MVDALLQARDVRFSWREREVLQGVSLDVMPGSVMCLMGMNGCGKTTFLDCALGGNKPTSGSITVRNIDVINARAPQRAHLLSYVPQIHERSFPYTVERMVLMGRTVHQGVMGIASDEDLAIVNDALRMCGIERLRLRPCSELSGGEMQMVMLARAVVQQAPLMVLDEPTAHLDFRNELLFLESVEALVSDGAVTVLMATHSPNQSFQLQAAGIDTQVALMDGGKVVRVGAPAEVLTPTMFRDHFGVEARMAYASADPRGKSSDAALAEDAAIAQIVPLATVEKSGTMQDGANLCAESPALGMAPAGCKQIGRN